MTAKRKKSGPRKLRWFFAVCLAMIAAVAFTDADDLPAALSENAGVLALYDVKDKIKTRFANSTPDILAAGKKDAGAKGYDRSDRAALDQLIEKKGI
jgi:hypothetical protein